MASVLDLSLDFDTPGDRLKWLLVVQLGLSAFLSDSAAAVAVLGLVAVVWTQRELLSLFLVVSPAFIVADVFWLIGGSHGLAAWVLAIIQLTVKAASLVNAFQWLQATSGSAAGATEYQPFGLGGSGRRDPFNSAASPASPPLNGTSLPTSGYTPPPTQAAGPAGPARSASEDPSHALL